DVIDNFDRVIVQISRIQILTSFICAIINSARRWWRNGAQRSNFGKEITLLLKLIAHAAPALFEHRNVHVSLALDRQQLQLLLLAWSVISETDIDLRPNSSFQANVDFVLIRIESDFRIFKLRRQIALG